jgi:hypothetical protein
VAKKECVMLTPPAVARRWGISPSKVLHWIRAGELRAIDVSKRRGGRPRFLVSISDLEAFAASRSSSLGRLADRPRKRRRARANDGVIEFF